MLRKRQVGWLVALGVALWILVALNIRLRPQSFVDPVRGSINFLTAPLAGWLSVWLCKFVGRLAADQILSGVAVVGAVAMMLDGLALRWFAGVYAFDEKTLRLSAAWLLWGYGVAFAIAVLWAARLPRKAA